MILLRVLVLVGVMLNSEQLLAQNYRYQEQDAFNFVSSDGNVWAQGRVNWYQGDQRWRIDTIRAELYHQFMGSAAQKWMPACQSRFFRRWGFYIMATRR